MKANIFFVALLAVTSLGYGAGVPKVDMNTADAAQLDSLLEGIGAKKAQTIVDWRNLHGAFRSVADVAKIKGMATLAEKNRDRMVFGARVASASERKRQAILDDNTLVVPFHR